MDRNHDQSGTAEIRYNLNKEIRLKASMLRSDLCHIYDVYVYIYIYIYMVSYIVLKGDVTVSAEERYRDEMNRDGLTD